MELVYEDDAVTIWLGNGVHVGVWSQPPRMAQVAPLQAVLARQFAERPSGHLFLTIIRATAGQAPKRDVRAAFGKFHDESANRIDASATVIMTRGLQQIMVKSFMSAVFAMSRSSCPRRVFTDVTEACSWLAKEAKRADKVGLGRFVLEGAQQALRHKQGG